MMSASNGAEFARGAFDGYAAFYEFFKRSLQHAGAKPGPDTPASARMAKVANLKKPLNPTLPKVPTGIQGLDEITGGGLPRGRPTLVCGGAGCGKTLLAAEFLVCGATKFGEPGVFMTFEESAEEL